MAADLPNARRKERLIKRKAPKRGWLDDSCKDILSFGRGILEELNSRAPSDLFSKLSYALRKLSIKPSVICSIVKE